MKKLLPLILLSIVLSACVSTTQVAQVDRDTYVVSSSSSSVLINNQTLLTESAATARKFCLEQNKEMVEDKDRFIAPDRGFGRRQFMFQFRCISKSS